MKHEQVSERRECLWPLGSVVVALVLGAVVLAALDFIDFMG